MAAGNDATDQSSNDADADGSVPIETNGRPAPPKDGAGLSPIFSVLSNARRRHVIRYLRTNEEGTLSDIAEYVAATENNKPESELTSAERKRVYVALYQTHLKRMDAAGMIDFDQDRGKVELADADTAIAHLELAQAIQEKENVWMHRTLTVAVIGGLIYAISAMAFGPDSVISLASVSAMIVGVVAIAALEMKERSENIARV